MNIKEVEAVVLKLLPKDRARLAGKLLESLEDLSEEETRPSGLKKQNVGTRPGPLPHTAARQQKRCYAEFVQGSVNDARLLPRTRGT